MFRNLESNLNNVLAWLNINSLKANPGKFQFMVLGTKKPDSFVLNADKNKIESSTEVTLLGVKIEEFKEHSLYMCCVLFYCLCYVSFYLICITCFAFQIFYSWYLLVYYAIFSPTLNKDFNNNNNNKT